MRDFDDSNLKRDLYKVWIRMSSRGYFPPPVRKGRLLEYGLELHSARTRLIEFSSSAEANRKRKEAGKTRET